MKVRAIQAKGLAALLVGFSVLLSTVSSAAAVTVGTLVSNPSSVVIDAGSQFTIDISSPDSTITTAVTATPTVAKYVSVTPTNSSKPGHFKFAVTGLLAGTASIKVHAAKGYADIMIPVTVNVPTLTASIDTSLMSSALNAFSVTSSSGSIPASKTLTVTSNKSSVIAVTNVARPSENQVAVEIKAIDAGIAKLTLSMVGYKTQTYSVTVTKPGLKSDKQRLAILPGEIQYVDIFSTDIDLTDVTTLQVHGHSESQLVTIQRVESSDITIARFAISVNAIADTTVLFSLTNFTSVSVAISQPTLKVVASTISLWQTQKVQIAVTSDDPDFLAGTLRASEVDGKDGSLLNFTAREVDVIDGIATFEIQAAAPDLSPALSTTQFSISSVSANLKPIMLTFTIRKPTLVVNVKTLQVAAGQVSVVALSSLDLPLASSTVIMASTSNAAYAETGVPHNNQVEIRGLAVGNAAVTFEVAGYAPVTLPVQVLKTIEIPTIPVAKVAPTVTGKAKLGTVLTAGKGTWTGSSLFTYSYKWYRCKASAAAASATIPSTCRQIAGAAAATYKLTSADVGSYTRVLVTATNGAGSRPSASKSTTMVTK